MARLPSPERDLQAGIVGTNPDRPIEAECFRTNGSFPDQRVVDQNPQFPHRSFPRPRYGVARTEHWNWLAVIRLYVLISRLPHSALLCWPGLALTETTSFDSGSKRHMA